ncbi:thioredoxin family protein [Saccharobesus litoralis]|uniref:Thioredoxin family protein n=1 Tax=Saccharobesus litoralis TaxID=2172099 RepID=A0A2S0VTT5_9ALTE|nr:glutaredoxin family protein [Saccharobesus litoralis]AWB67619.1 thioredoxin family protein [Saccharobesus litoralis]
MTKVYTLYGTDCCHLCELAEQVCISAGIMACVEKIDIANDEQLVDLYGVKIPVLKNNSTQQELNWPFDAQMISQIKPKL